MDWSIGDVAYQDVQAIADSPRGLNNLCRSLVGEYEYVWIGASIVCLRGKRHECDVVHNNLKSSLKKGFDSRRACESQRVCDENNRPGQFDSPVLWIAYDGMQGSLLGKLTVAMCAQFTGRALAARHLPLVVVRSRSTAELHNALYLTFIADRLFLRRPFGLNLNSRVAYFLSEQVTVIQVE